MINMNFKSKVLASIALSIAALGTASATTYSLTGTGANSYFMIGQNWTENRNVWSYDNLFVNVNGNSASLTGYSINSIDHQKYTFNFQFTNASTDANGVMHFQTPGVGQQAGTITGPNGFVNNYYTRHMVANFGNNATPYNSASGAEFGMWLQQGPKGSAGVRTAGANAGDFNVGIRCAVNGSGTIGNGLKNGSGGALGYCGGGSVPLPGSLLLLGVGLVGLGIRSKFSAKA
jgi:PEP-CTERM motif